MNKHFRIIFFDLPRIRNKDFIYIFHIHLVLNHCIYSLIVMALAVRPYAVPMNLICIYDYSIAAIFPSDGFPPNK